MSADVLVSSGLGKNLKFRDLARRLAGPANAMWVLHRLWAFTALYRPDGDLTGIDPAEIPLTETEWKSLVEARKEGSSCGFLNVSGEVVTVHDWPPASQRVGWLERRRVAGSIAGQASVASRKAAGEQAFKLGMMALHSNRKLVDIPEVEVGKKRVNGQKSILEDPATERYLEAGFLWFYEKVYPKRCGRTMARKAWGKLHRDLLVTGDRQGLNKAVKIKIAEYIGAKLESQEWETTKERLRFVPDPATFINQRRWED